MPFKARLDCPEAATASHFHRSASNGVKGASLAVALGIIPAIDSHAPPSAWGALKLHLCRRGSHSCSPLTFTSLLAFCFLLPSSRLFILLRRLCTCNSPRDKLRSSHRQRIRDTHRAEKSATHPSITAIGGLTRA